MNWNKTQYYRRPKRQSNAAAGLWRIYRWMSVSGLRTCVHALWRTSQSMIATNSTVVERL